MTKIKCVFCAQQVDQVNDQGVCKNCWCPEGAQKWKAKKNLLPKDLMKQDMECLPFVKWDRFIHDLNKKKVVLYGWIDRNDTKKDFLIMEYRAQEGTKWSTGYMTSSAKHCKEINSALGMDEESRVDCQRVEDQFDVSNSIKMRTE